MSPGFHPNFPFETLLQWTRSNHHKSCQSLSFWRNFSIVIQTSSCPASSQKNHLYPLMISTTFVQFQTSSSFPKFSKKSLLPAFNLTCLLTHCLLLFSLLTGSFILLKLLFLKSTMTSSLRWIVVRSLHLFFSTYLLPLILSIIPSFLLVFKIGSVLMVCPLDWFSSYLSLRSQAVSINDSISAFSTLSCGVPQGFRTWPTPFHSLYNSSWLGDLKKFPQISFVRWWHPAVHLFHSYNFCSISWNTYHHFQWHSLLDELEQTASQSIKNWISSHWHKTTASQIFLI